MIIGEPYKFAIITNVIKTWNIDVSETFITINELYEIIEGLDFC